MPALLAAVLGFVVSGLAWRILASIGFGLTTAYFVNDVISDYLNKSLRLMNGALPPDIAALLGMVGADDCLSVMCGGITFIAVYKSLKLMFVRS